MKNLKKKIKNMKGITLISLVITIIILIILAGVSIGIVFGNEGIFSKTQTAVEKYQNAQNEEESIIAKLENYILSNNRVGEVSDELVDTIADKLIKQGITNPTGTIIAYSVNNVPTGYLKCEGQEISRAEYSNLFNIIGTTYGSGNGSTTFNLPDLRGEFLRGSGDNSHTSQGDGENVGTHQDATWHDGFYLANSGNNGIYIPWNTDRGYGIVNWKDVRKF